MQYIKEFTLLHPLYTSTWYQPRFRVFPPLSHCSRRRLSTTQPPPPIAAPGRPILPSWGRPPSSQPLQQRPPAGPARVGLGTTPQCAGARPPGGCSARPRMAVWARLAPAPGPGGLGAGGPGAEARQPGSADPSAARAPAGRGPPVARVGGCGPRWQRRSGGHGPRRGGPLLGAAPRPPSLAFSAPLRRLPWSLWRPAHCRRFPACDGGRSTGRAGTVAAATAAAAASARGWAPIALPASRRLQVPSRWPPPSAVGSSLSRHHAPPWFRRPLPFPTTPSRPWAPARPPLPPTGPSPSSFLAFWPAPPLISASPSPYLAARMPPHWPWARPSPSPASQAAATGSARPCVCVARFASLRARAGVLSLVSITSTSST
jgi:hypothetical protein